MVHHLQIIGEAAKGLPDSFRDAHPGVPWRRIVAMRNILVHQYFGVDRDAVWAVVEDDLPELRERVALMLAE